MLPSLSEYLLAKNQGRLCIPSGDIDDQKILQSDWMRAFWPTTYKEEFSQIWDLHRETDDCKFFQFRLFAAKNNSKIL